MPAVQRQGDPNTSGGINTSGVGSVRVNGRPVAVPGISVSPHPCCGSQGCGIHCSAITTGGSGSVRAGGRPVIRDGDPDTCGHSRTAGSASVRVA
jgi:uncharacterized Zn-binding protein involved in type VI secretion